MPMVYLCYSFSFKTTGTADNAGFIHVEQIGVQVKVNRVKQAEYGTTGKPQNTGINRNYRAPV